MAEVRSQGEDVHSHGHGLACDSVTLTGGVWTLLLLPLAHTSPVSLHAFSEVDAPPWAVEPLLACFHHLYNVKRSSPWS